MFTRKQKKSFKINFNHRGVLNHIQNITHGEKKISNSNVTEIEHFCSVTNTTKKGKFR